MDPLSITASVAGLLTAATKISSLLDAIASAKNAPKTIQNAQNEVRHVELTLRSLRRYLWQLELADTRRRELICLDEVIVPLADAMLELSDFETLLNKLTNLTNHRAYISWGSHSKSMEEHLARITRQKTSLIMILNILQCESDLEAFQSQQSLHLLVGEILSENKVLKGKLEHLEVSVDARSMLTSRPDTELRSMSHGTAADIDDDAATIRGMSRQTSQRSTVRISRQGTLEFAFEKVLEHSWVYKRNANNNCDASFVSSVQRSYAWSVFSEYSLADISILSVIAMPITTLDVSNGIYYIAGKEDAAQEEGDQTHARGSNSSSRVTGTDFELSEDKNSQQPEYEPRVLGNGSQEGTLEEAHEFSRCKGCGEIIEEDDVFGFAENRWHLNCFCCQSCSRLLDTDTDFRLVSESSLLCSGCMYSCATCGNKIEDLALVSGDWTFCVGCFCCQRCNKRIENVRHARTSRGIFCMSCNYRPMTRPSKQQAGEEEDGRTTKGLHPLPSARMFLGSSQVDRRLSFRHWTSRLHAPEAWITARNKTIGAGEVQASWV